MQRALIKNFSLQHTLESGQFFQYEKKGEWYYVITTERVFKVKQKGDVLYYDNVAKNALFRFLGLYVPYEHILGVLHKDNAVKDYIHSCPGLRVMRYDPWQCSVSFLCSSASNIPKIRGNLFQLAHLFGKKKKYDGKKFFLFPRQGSLLRLPQIRKAGVGFRASFIQALNALSPAFFSSLSLLPYAEAKQHLCMQKGIGEKIADCILLFAYHKWEAFPFDVWIEKAVRYHYGTQRMPKKKLLLLPTTIFPHYRGYAQQFLYHGFRHRQRAAKQSLFSQEHSSLLHS